MSPPGGATERVMASQQLPNEARGSPRGATPSAGSQGRRPWCRPNPGSEAIDRVETAAANAAARTIGAEGPVRAVI